MRIIKLIKTMYGYKAILPNGARAYFDKIEYVDILKRDL